MQTRHINNHLHLTVQHKIQRLIGKEDVFLEHYFKGHIADVFWKSKKIVFEVQCSPISLREAKKRTEDFEALGIHIVWILHQKTFNKIHMSPSEEYLVTYKTVYYTNISQAGEGIIFDQEQSLCFNRRTLKSPPIEIDITSPLMTKHYKNIYFENSLCSIPLIKRLKLSPKVWKEKGQIWTDNLKRKANYYFRYLRWKVRLS